MFFGDKLKHHGKLMNDQAKFDSEVIYHNVSSTN